MLYVRMRYFAPPKLSCMHPTRGPIRPRICISHVMYHLGTCPHAVRGQNKAQGGIVGAVPAPVSPTCQTQSMHTSSKTHHASYTSTPFDYRPLSYYCLVPSRLFLA